MNNINKPTNKPQTRLIHSTICIALIKYNLNVNFFLGVHLENVLKKFLTWNERRTNEHSLNVYLLYFTIGTDGTLFFTLYNVTGTANVNICTYAY